MGAAIAAGNQAENGNCALFEHAARTKNKRISDGKFSFILKFQFEIEAIKAIDNRIKMSPTRLEKMVIDPDAEDDAFW